MADFNHFAQLADKMETATVQIVKKTAFDMLAHAQERAAVKTGFMKNSGYVVTNHGDNTYGAGVSGAGELLPPLDPPEGDVTAVIGFAADYSLPVEMGTRYMAAQPFLTPAAEDVRGPFLDALSRLEDGMRGA